MNHKILFTGHMIDERNRATPRFPAIKQAAVKNELQKRIIKMKDTIPDPLIGIAGGACGGDILFHEICRELEIPGEMYLALPVNEFKKESVSFAGNEWDERFDKLIKEIPVHILDEQSGKNNNVWEQANVWMLKEGLNNGGSNMTLLALWDGKKGDDTGGTEHMVKEAKNEGATVYIIDINKV